MRAAVNPSEKHFGFRDNPMRPPSEVDAGALHSFEGYAARKAAPTNEGSTDRAQESEDRGISTGSSTFHGRAPATGRKPLGLSFFSYQGRSRPSSSASRRFGSANSLSNRARVAELISVYSRAKIRGYEDNSCRSAPRNSSTPV